jgi:tRNA (guanosine-2'-O-)-methyltransferase
MPTKKRMDRMLEVLSKRQNDIVVVLENVHDPHNVSAVLRTCDAIGILDIYLIYHSGQKFPQLNNKSSGRVRKWMMVHKFTSVTECFAELKSKGFSILSTYVGNGTKSVYNVDYTQKVAFVFGNEHEGVTNEVLDSSDSKIVIPQVGFAESLNISVACSICLYEAFRQKNIAGHYDIPKLDSSEQKMILESWSG